MCYTLVMKKSRDLVRPDAAIGRRRAVIAIVAGCALYFAAHFFVPYLFQFAYSRLLAAWNVTSRNVSRAPQWVVAFISYSPYASVQLSGIVAICSSAVIIHLTRDGHPRRDIKKTALGGSVLAIAAALLLAALFLLSGISRMGRRVSNPNLDISIVSSALTYIIVIIGEELLARGLVMRLLTAKRRRTAYLLSALVFVIISAELQAHALLIVNLAIMSLAASALYERSGSVIPPIIFRAVWMIAAYLIFGLPGGEAGLYEIYPVSLYWLNGGAAGVLCGLAATIVLSAALVLVTRGLPPFGILSALRRHRRPGSPSTRR